MSSQDINLLCLLSKASFLFFVRFFCCCLFESIDHITLDAVPSFFFHLSRDSLEDEFLSRFSQGETFGFHSNILVVLAFIILLYQSTNSYRRIHPGWDWPFRRRISMHSQKDQTRLRREGQRCPLHSTEMHSILTMNHNESL